MDETAFDELDPVAIDRFIADKQEENLHLDFKTVSGADLSRREDRQNLAIAISGFANSDGGVIVWGVDARQNAEGGDCAVGKTEIHPLSVFMSRLTQFAGDAAMPTVPGVRHRRLLAGDDRGFAATLVPASDGVPHMAKLGVDRYMKRSGSQFLKMEHFEVEDMFGRRRRPRLALTYRIVSRLVTAEHIWYSVILAIENSGRGSAKAPFLALRIQRPYALDEIGVDGNRREGLPRLVTSRGSEEVLFGAPATLVVHPGTVHEVAAVKGMLYARTIRSTSLWCTIPLPPRTFACEPTCFGSRALTCCRPSEGRVPSCDALLP
jgi:hypothetical protein